MTNSRWTLILHFQIKWFRITKEKFFLILSKVTRINGTLFVSKNTTNTTTTTNTTKNFSKTR